MSIERVKEQVVHVCDRTRHELLSIIAALPAPFEAASAAPQEWMTALQLAEYWQLYNKDGGPTTGGILKWAKRPTDQFPLPHAYMGDMMRFNRDEANQWAKEEAERRRAENERKRLKLAG